MTKQLKPFASEYDMIAAFTAEEASHILKGQFGLTKREMFCLHMGVACAIVIK